MKHGWTSDSSGVLSAAGEQPPVLLLPELARTRGESNPGRSIDGDPCATPASNNSLPLAWNSDERACFSPPDGRLLARTGRRTVVESIVPARLRGTFEMASAFTIHHELLPVPSFCTRMKRLCSDKLCLMEFYHNKPHRTMKDNFLSEKKTEKKLLTEQQNIMALISGYTVWECTQNLDWQSSSLSEPNSVHESHFILTERMSPAVTTGLL